MSRQPNLSPWIIMIIIIYEGQHHKVGRDLYTHDQSGDADPTVLAHKLKQIQMVGPAGPIIKATSLNQSNEFLPGYSSCDDSRCVY